MYRLLIPILFLFLCSCAPKPHYTNPHIAIQTKYGDIELELYPKQAPKTVAAFLSYIDSGFYNNSSFYRVLNMENQPSNAPKTELIQGGIWKTNYKKAGPAMEDLLIHVGRRKFLTPLYSELCKTKSGKVWAQKIYQNARPNYHSVSQTTIDELLGTM
jgi:hypothetical protein